MVVNMCVLQERRVLFCRERSVVELFFQHLWRDIITYHITMHMHKHRRAHTHLVVPIEGEGVLTLQHQLPTIWPDDLSVGRF